MDSEAVLPIRTNDTEEDVSETSEMHLKYIGMVHNDVEDEEAKAGSSRPFPGGDTGFLESSVFRKALAALSVRTNTQHKSFPVSVFSASF